MNQPKKALYLGIALMFALLLTGLSACGTDDEDKGQAAEENNEEGTPLGDEEITITYMSWADSIANTSVIKAVLEEVGYDVEIEQVATGPMFASVADGSADAMASAWLPTNEGENWEQFKDDLVKVQKNTDDTPIGLTVPEYMDVESLEDLKNNKELGEATDWKIYGIEPGTGTTELMEEALDEYGLDDWELVKSSETAMLSELKGKVEDKEPVIVSLWKPHYAFGKWDLRILDDPKNVYGDPDSIYTLAREDLEEDSPAAFNILEQFQWDEDLMDDVMVNIEKGMDEDEVGKAFVEEHQDVVEEWTKDVE